MSIPLSTKDTFYYFCNNCYIMLTSLNNYYKQPIKEFITDGLVLNQPESILTNVEVQECQQKVLCLTCKALRG